MRQDITGVTIYIYLALASNTKAHIQIICCFCASIRQNKTIRKEERKVKKIKSRTRIQQIESTCTYIYEEDIKKHPSQLVVPTFYWCAMFKNISHHTFSRAKIAQQLYIWYVKCEMEWIQLEQNAQKKNSLTFKVIYLAWSKWVIFQNKQLFKMSKKFSWFEYFSINFAFLNCFVFCSSIFNWVNRIFDYWITFSSISIFKILFNFNFVSKKLHLLFLCQKWL